MKMHIRAIKRAPLRALKRTALTRNVQVVRRGDRSDHATLPPFSPLPLTLFSKTLSLLVFSLLSLSVTSVSATPSEQPERPEFSEDGSLEMLRAQRARRSTSDVTGNDGKAVKKTQAPQLGGWEIDLSGYARLPLMISGGITGERRPYLIDDQYFLSGFAYTRVSEREWVELFVTAQRGNTRIVTGLFSSELSDWAQAELPKGQKGIATAFIDHRWEPHEDINVDARVGVFWERLGYIDAYDTYLFGRTHIGGGRLKLEAFDTLYMRAGFGAHQGDPVRERGFTPMRWLVLGAKWRWFDIAGYWVKTSTQDGEYDSGELQDVLTRDESFIEVLGADLFATIPRVGQVSFGISLVDAANTLFLGNAHELLHTSGGGVNGLKSRYFGEPGTGEILAMNFDFKWRLRDSFKGMGKTLNKVLGRSELRFFGMSAHVVSYGQADLPDQNFHDRQWFKWGMEGVYRPLSILKGWFVGTRFDRVILDTDYDSLSFKVISPRLGFSPLPTIDLFASYAFYDYGENIRLDSAQLRNDGPTSYRLINGPPDETVFKLQAQARW